MHTCRLPNSRPIRQQSAITTQSHARHYNGATGTDSVRQTIVRCIYIRDCFTNFVHPCVVRILMSVHNVMGGHYAEVELTSKLIHVHVYSHIDFSPCLLNLFSTFSFGTTE